MATVVPLWIGGKEVLRPLTFDVVSPLTNETCWKAVAATSTDAVEAVDAAATAFESWSKSEPSTRQSILLAAASLLEAHVEQHAEYMCTEMGADKAVALHFVIPLSIRMLRDIASRIATVCGSVPASQEEGRSCMVLKEPYGAVLGIVPWNAPYVFGIRAAATAIATGNTTVLKSSELSPRCYWALGRVFADAGLPPGVLNVVCCPATRAAEVVTTMIEHPAIRKVNFTGGAATGARVARTCGANLKPCLMELGGKNSAIVLPDADLGKAAKACISGSFLNAGQICMATDRIIVHASIAAPFVEVMKSALDVMSEHGKAVPPNVVSTSSKARLAALISAALSEAPGAHVIHGDDGKAGVPGTQFIPTLLGGLSEDAAFWKEESFGPVAAVVVVKSEEEAIELANSTGYGLSAAVFTQDLRRGLAVAKKLQSGAVHINGMTIHDEPALPFGGVKNSGWGRFNAEQGMEEFLVTKALTWDD